MSVTALIYGYFPSVRVDACLPPSHVFLLDWGRRILDGVREYVINGQDLNQARNGVTPLWVACQNNHALVAKLLIDAGADVDVAKESDGATPLFKASQNGHSVVVQLLLEAGAKPVRLQQSAEMLANL